MPDTPGTGAAPSENGASTGGAEQGTPVQETAGGGDGMEDEEEGEDDAEETAVMPVRGPLPPQEGTWASCVRLLDPVEGVTVECLELGESA